MAREWWERGKQRINIYVYFVIAFLVFIHFRFYGLSLNLTCSLYAITFMYSRSTEKINNSMFIFQIGHRYQERIPNKNKS